MKLNRDAAYLVVIVLLIALCGQLYYSYHYVPQKERQVRVYYNQEVEANQQIVRTIQESDKFVYFAIYTFTRTDIKDALLGAKHRGLDVRGVVDRDQTQRIEEQGAIVKEIENAGIPLAFQDHSAIMHIKTVVTEKAYVSGSYNWTSAATNLNDEVIEVGRDESIRRQYENLLQELFRRYPPRLP
jgi:phosphatidylserine/phosphatidylglycerophosphate/cardiolipin synthase-like enzyme